MFNVNNGGIGNVGIGTINYGNQIFTKFLLYVPSNLRIQPYDRLSATLQADLTQNCPSKAELGILNSIQ
jgi:hypothetical protein